MREYVRATKTAPKEIIIDADANDVTLYGKQEGRAFHGFYGDYCYLPLSLYAGDHLLFTKLRPSNIDASLGTVEALKIVVPEIRKRFPKVRIILRADLLRSPKSARRSVPIPWHFILPLTKNVSLYRFTLVPHNFNTQQGAAGDHFCRICEPLRRSGEQ